MKLFAVSTPLLSVSLLATAPAVPADSECFLSGTFRANPDMTIASYEAVKKIGSEHARRALTQMFGSTVHQWQCTRFQAFMYAGREEAYPLTHGWADAEVHLTGHDSARVVIRDGGHAETLNISVEGPCYKVLEPDEEFFVYYCPDASANNLPSSSSDSESTPNDG